VITFSFTPPSVHAGAVVHAAAEVAVGEAAQLVFDESQRMVPVDTGALKDSGRVSQDGLEAAIAYGAEDAAGRNGQDTAAYAVPQHERLDFEHSNGQAKYLEIPMHSQAERVAEVIVGGLRRVI
jgi:hypothetical protein